MALVRAAIGVGRRRLGSHCSCLAGGLHLELHKGVWELRGRCFSSMLNHNEVQDHWRSTLDFRSHQYVSRRFYAAGDLPSHQPLGMPSLSPTMTQGNLVKWKKKEGDKVSAGEVLCEIETDKATVDMECMEDGYLAKILYPEGSKDIKVGQVIAITVEEQGDIGKFKDYKPSEAPAAPAKPAPKKDAAGAGAGAGDLPSHQPLGMPSLSPTMTQGNLVKWKKKEGDKVSAGEVLCEIETDKATVDMECMEDGYLAKILYPEGSKDIKVGQVIAIVVEEQGDIGKFKDYKPSEASAAPAKPASKKDASPPPTSKPAEAAPPPRSAPASSGDRIIASPNARKFAQDNEISLSGVAGTGPGGRILRADVEGLKGGQQQQQKQQQQQQQPRRAEAGAQAGVPSSLDYTDLPNAQIRRVIAQRLLQSKQTIPHYYLTVDVRVDKLMALRTQLNSKLEKDKRKKLSVNDFVLKAAALALKKVPECNSSWTDEYIRQFHNVNISVAVQTDRGLMVPVVKDADKKGLGTISEDVRTLAEKARDNALKPSDYEGGTFTVSNLGGPFGIKQFCAIINPPQSCILAVGTTDKRVVPGESDGEFAAATFMSATLSCDHRVVDGAIGAHWLGAFKGYIEDPMTLLL